MDDLDWSDEDSTNMDVDSMDSISITSGTYLEYISIPAFNKV